MRIGVEVEPAQVPGFLSLVRSRPWPFVDLGEGRYDVHVPLSGSVFGVVAAAMSEFRHFCDKAGVHTRIVFAARLRAATDPYRRYPVMPRTRMPEREWIAAPVRGLLWWRIRGYIRARSLAEARSLLPGFAARNPEAGETLMVVGPPDPRDRSVDERPRSYGGMLLGLLIVVAGALYLLYLLFDGRPPGAENRQLVIALLGLVCLYGTWHAVRRIPEGRVDTWLPLVLTVLAAPTAIALGSLGQETYLASFGIGSGEVDTTGPSRVIAVFSSLWLVLLALLIALGAFGFLRHFHVTVHGYGRFWSGLMVVLVMTVYGLTAVVTLMDRDRETAERHISLYREGAAPQHHVGVQPTAVCVEETGENPVNRIGPPLTTDRPVLYFAGTGNVDLLWDREEGTTRVTRFSVTLTPVSSLADTCPPPP
ncbi:hypothetical protein [Nocardiopsis sp. CC223A]|uniref:hypothetical protein n=1 Tax=Nocardiopsis sp. CC223A TaxID=3044051 RepID=UPI00278C6F57|nr:hypothetical protein [Nocardiopsis sp. CC223A]